jgi:hypothetical protein
MYSSKALALKIQTQKLIKAKAKGSAKASSEKEKKFGVEFYVTSCIYNSASHNFNFVNANKSWKANGPNTFLIKKPPIHFFSDQAYKTYNICSFSRLVHTSP